MIHEAGGNHRKNWQQITPLQQAGLLGRVESRKSSCPILIDNWKFYYHAPLIVHSENIKLREMELLSKQQPTNEVGVWDTGSLDKWGNACDRRLRFISDCLTEDKNHQEDNKK